MQFYLIFNTLMLVWISWDLHGIKRDTETPSFKFISEVKQHINDSIKNLVRRELKKNANKEE